ncbi:MAG: CopG family transcriptional regulator [Cellvibrionales bacterium]|nr:CopG family transcriptional regulator [Cellvibrionales bacterium]
MQSLAKRTTVYLDSEIHRALKLRSASTQTSLSALVNEATRLLMREDREDLEASKHRAAEPEINYETLLADLQKHGKL